LCSLLIFVANVIYKNTYASNKPSEVSVQAGLVSYDFAIDALFSHVGLSKIDGIQVAVVNVYFMSFTYGFLSDPRFATGVSPVSCSGSNCTSFFLPGGLDLVRLTGPHGGPNSTLFDHDQFDDSTAILTHNAPGYQLEFSPIEGGSPFNVTTDCTAYGKSTGNGLFMCLTSNGTRIYAGMCPHFVAPFHNRVFLPY
jgi:hypothetical protein